MLLSSVVLPQPDGPRAEETLPPSMWKLTPATPAPVPARRIVSGEDVADSMWASEVPQFHAHNATSAMLLNSIQRHR